MIINEKIARWLGLELTELVRDTDTKEPAQIIRGDGGAFKYEPIPRYDTDIALWHGKDGLLALIEGKCEWEWFYRAWLEDHVFARSQPYVTEIAWAFRRAESAELAAVLATMIDGEFAEES